MIPLVVLVVLALVVVAGGVVFGLRAADRRVHGTDDDDTLVDSSHGLAALDDRALGLDDLGDVGPDPVAVVAVVARDLRAAGTAPRVYGTPPPGQHPISRLRILIIDDEPQVGRMIARLMHAHEVTTVTSGEAALATLATDDRFDAILCDLIMPEMSGVKLAAAIADRHGELRSRLAFLAGRNVSPDAKRLLAGGDTRWVTKPVQYAQLASCVSEIVSATRAVDDAEPPLTAPPTVS